MRVWTNASFRAFDLLAGPEPEDVAGASDVAAILRRAAELGAPVTLSRQEPGARRLPVDTAAIRLEGDSLVVGRPQYRPGQKALSVGERLEIRIGLPEGSYLGETSIVLRFALDHEPARNATFGLAKPRLLVLDDRRAQERIGLAAEEEMRAELLCMPRHSLLARGPVVDLSVGGLRLRGHEPPRVRPGDRVLVRAKLASGRPGDLDARIHAAGIVVHAALRRDGTSDIGVRFQREEPEVDRFIRHLAAPVQGLRLA